MKKVLYFATLLLAMVFASCSKEEIGETATQATAGEWYVTLAGCDEDDNVIFEDDYRWHCLTYNTAKNVPTEMYITDLGEYLGIMVKIDVNPAAKTFSTANNDWVENMMDDNKIKIWGGKIVYGGGTQNNGSVADYIEFNIALDNDEDAGVEYHHLKVKGVRYSGLTEND